MMGEHYFDLRVYANVDWYDSAELGNGYHLAWTVDDDGNRWPWLVAHLCPDCSARAVHGSYDGAIHERWLDRLPERFRERLGLIHRCGYEATTTGYPCRNQASRPGQRCKVHSGRDSP